MSRGDKYAEANALSKLFEEMLRRQNPKDDDMTRKRKAAGAMDNELGKEWRDQIAIKDEKGPEFIDVAILEIEPLEPDEAAEEVDEMYKKARKFSEDFVRPGDDLENHPDQYYLENKPKDKPCISSLLRQLADAFEEMK